VRIPAHSEHLDITGIGSGQAFADFDRGRFSGSVRPKETEAFSRSHFDVQAIDCDNVFVGLAKFANAESGMDWSFRHGLSIASDGPLFNIRIGASILRRAVSSFRLRKTPPECHSERSEESLFGLNPRTERFLARRSGFGMTIFEFFRKL